MNEEDNSKAKYFFQIRFVAFVAVVVVFVFVQSENYYQL